MEKIYIKKPLYIKNGIPYFSRESNYVLNYEKISLDHCDFIKKTKKPNPFIPEDLWKETEKSTIDLLKKHVRTNDKILDVGVGLARILDNFPNNDRYGMDISTSYLLIAKNKGVNVCYSLIEDCPYSPNYFDVVICTDVLEHVLDLNLAIKNILCVLKKNGILILRVPYKENLKFYIDYKAYEFVHLRNFDEYSLQLLFTKIFDCKVIEIKKSGYNSFILNILRRRFNFKPLIYFINSFYYLISKIFPEKIQNWFFNYSEINVVIKKDK